jgi:hypothetical protein
MLQWAIHVCFKCMFQIFICFKRMLQVFNLDTVKLDRDVAYSLRPRKKVVMGYVQVKLSQL